MALAVLAVILFGTFVGAAVMTQSGEEN